MNDEEQAKATAEAAANSGAAGLLADVAERIGARAGASAVFGERIERDSVTVVPVAQVMLGVGAGSGGSEEEGSGAGGGGGAVTRPLGYLEVRDDGASFVPLRPTWMNPGVLATAAFITLIASRTVLKLAKR